METTTTPAPPEGAWEGDWKTSRTGPDERSRRRRPVGAAEAVVRHARDARRPVLELRDEAELLELRVRPRRVLEGVSTKKV